MNENGSSPEEDMMMKSTLAAIAVLASTAAADASALVAWEVTNVSWGDVLNVRAWPSSKSQIQSAYPNGTVLSMTGRCMNKIDLGDIAGKPAWVQRGEVRYTWCEVWHDPADNEDFVTGWAYMRYMRPH